ncbi:MAG: acetyl-CoA synthetase [Euryarchaeota archaeon]|nr:acetyl-CoA synthetase [Euryarchaeota archaeon]
MNEYETKMLLRRYGIKVPEGRVVEKLEDVESLNLKYPLVAKVLSEKILHKSDVGGVILNIQNKDEAKNAFLKIHEKFSTPVLFEEMAGGGVELIIGVLRDPSFGPAIMFGLGGIFTEVYRDVTFRVLPITEADAWDMLEDIRGSKILKGYRGVKVNREAIVDTLLKISRLVMDNGDKIEGMDLNPVLAGENDCIVLDAKLIEASRQ